MKKFIVLLLSFVISFSYMTYAQTKEYQKEREKMEKKARSLAKKKAKEYKKDKWETPEALDLETILTNYYLATEPSCGGTKKHRVQTLNDARKINVAEKRLLIDAQTMYAQEMRTMLTQTIMGKDPLIGEAEAAVLVSEILAKTEKEFNGDLERAFILYKMNPGGQTMTVNAFYIIDEEKGLARLDRLADSVMKTNEIQNAISNH